VRLRWPPPGHLSTQFVDSITAAHKRGDLSEGEVSDLFVKSYNSGRLEDLLRQWEPHPWLSRRLPILREGIENHLAGRYFSSVCMLLPQIEGVHGDALGRKPKPRGDAERLLGDTTLSTAAREFYIKVVNESFEWNDDAPIPELSRHAILHGRATNFGTEEHSLKVLLIMDEMISAIAAYRPNRGESESDSPLPE
jgi:hypothetical protein